jgi:glycine reductase complex component B subunit gamma
MRVKKEASHVGTAGGLLPEPIFWTTRGRRQGWGRTACHARSRRIGAGGAAIAKELERSGLPTVQVSTMTPVAVMVGANRIVPAAGIIHPLGNAELSAEDEKTLRRRIVAQALQALQTEVAQPTVFGGDVGTTAKSAGEQTGT